MTTQNRIYRGFVTFAPPHLNSDQQPDRYLFSGLAVSDGKPLAGVFRFVPMLGHATAEQFAADVAEFSPLPGELELLAPAFKLARFTYTNTATGQTQTVQADDLTGISPTQIFRSEPVKEAEPVQEPEPEFIPMPPEPPTPGLIF